MAKPVNLPVWFPDAAELMVRERIDFRQAAARLGAKQTSEELAKLSKVKEFQALFQKARNRYYETLAGDRTRTKQSLVGQMLYCIQMLMEENAWDKALEGGLKLAKVEGWLDESSKPQTVLNLVTQEELEKARQALLKEMPLAGTPSDGSPERTSESRVN